ncbi:SAM-dependent methyltransferase [Streptomyces sp. SID3343]|uniref:SAM-dependent methyltransferase n=1 Tax=Streptomyces sp. SID3343 TaxID=2690260 RepID=UPI00136C7077|nr:SAM-dependent methyltransferase [Streptomyces sp. SID3343]
MGSAEKKIDVDVAHTARIWNYWLGGRDNYPVDRRAGDEIRAIHPGIGDYAQADRDFLDRSVTYLAGEVGIRQFLDIGTGLPTAGNTHEVAQRIAPDARVVYVDNDPLVLVHARALLRGTSEGAIDYVDADLRDVDTILAAAARTLDFTRPVGLVLLGVVIFLGDDEDPYGIVRRLLDALPAGSHLVLSHTVTGPAMPDVDAAVAYWNQHGTPHLTQRTPDRIAAFFEGLDLLDPGIVPCSRWRPNPPPRTPPAEVAMYGAVARKP